MGIIVIFVTFILQRIALRNRLIRLAGSHDLQTYLGGLDAPRAASANAISALLFSALEHARQCRCNEACSFAGIRRPPPATGVLEPANERTPRACPNFLAMIRPAPISRELAITN
jgi:hypothetical protein